MRELFIDQKGLLRALLLFFFYKYTDQHVFFLGHYSLVYCTEIFHKLKAFFGCIETRNRRKISEGLSVFVSISTLWRLFLSMLRFLALA